MDSRDREYDAYEKEEGWRLAHGYPPRDKRFRKKINIEGIEVEVINSDGIKAFVDNDPTYPGITVASPTGGPPEQIVDRKRDGRTVIEREDGSRYTRAPQKGDSYPVDDLPVTVPKKGIKINLETR